MSPHPSKPKTYALRTKSTSDISNSRSLQINLREHDPPIGLDTLKGLIVFSGFRFKVSTMFREMNVCDASESNKVEISFCNIRTLASKAVLQVSLGGG